MIKQFRVNLVHKHRVAVVILLIGLLIRLPLILQPMNYLGYPWREADTASIARNFATHGYNLFYPQINWGGAGPGYVEAEFQLYPFIIALLYGVFGEQLWLGSVVSLAFSILTCIMFYALACRLLRPHEALWALGFFVISPVFLRWSVDYMPDATAFCFYVTALYLFHRWLAEQKLSILLLAGISTALAILVKPTTIHIGLIFLLLILERYRLRVFTNWRIWLFGLVSLVPGTLWYLHARNLYLQYGNTFGVISGGDSKFGNLLDYWFSPRFYLSAVMVDVNKVLTPFGAIVFVLGFVLYLRSKQNSLLLFGTLTMIAYYMLVPRYASAPELGTHYHIFFVPFAALGIAYGLGWVFSDKSAIHPISRLATYVVGIFCILLMARDIGSFYRQMFEPQAQELINCAAQVAAVVPKQDRIIVSVTGPSLVNGIPDNYQNPIIFFYSDRFGWSLPEDQHTPEKVERFRQDGAKYFVIYSAALYHANQSLGRYLEDTAIQIGSGIDAGCGIYRLKT